MLSAFMASLMELTDTHPNVLYLTADSGEGGLDLIFRKSFPERSINFGISEANMVAAASGMALCGKTPFLYTTAPFLAYRAFEFIRDDVCLQNASVKMFGSGSGISIGALGPTHHGTEDIAVLNSLPNLTIFSPSTPRQAYQSVWKAYEIPGPVYVRLGMGHEQEFFDEGYQVSKSGFELLKNGTDVGIITTGAVLAEVLKAAAMLENKGISAGVASVFCIKPFDTTAFIHFASCFRHLFCVEEHNVIGGLGSILADHLNSEGLNISLNKIGLGDHFAKGYGDVCLVRKENGLDAESITEFILGKMR